MAASKVLGVRVCPTGQITGATMEHLDSRAGGRSEQTSGSACGGNEGSKCPRSSHCSDGFPTSPMVLTAVSLNITPWRTSWHLCGFRHLRREREFSISFLWVDNHWIRALQTALNCFFPLSYIYIFVFIYTYRFF